MIAEQMYEDFGVPVESAMPASPSGST